MFWFCNVGDVEDQFSIEVHHGGFFVGSGHLRTYVDGRIDWFDHCEVDTWSPLWLDDFVEQLGYLKTGLCRVYWLLPGRDLSDGLRIIASDGNTNVMASVVDRVKNLIVYIDHEDIIANANFEDIVAEPKAQLPKVLSPVKVIHVEEKQGEELPEFYKNLGKETNYQGDTDNEVDDQFVDGDNDIDDGDDDLFVEGGVEQVTTKTKKAKGSRSRGDIQGSSNHTDEDTTTDEELVDLSGEEDGPSRMRFPQFREEDQTFRLGMMFDSVES